MSLELRNVVKNYPQPGGGVTPVLNIDSFRLEPAEQVVLVGHSGGGKTTLLNIIAGITAPDSGSVTIAGTDLFALSEASRDRFRALHIGYVFQTFNLLPAFTALENVLLGMSFSGKPADTERARKLLDDVGLTHRLDNRPHQLSVGEQQRVAVARALVNQPSLLLADEPTANVDVANQNNVLKLIREACSAAQVSLLMVTHATDVAEQFERIERLSDFNRPELAS